VYWNVALWNVPYFGYVECTVLILAELHRTAAGWSILYRNGAECIVL
jgi:hypothetical protein